MPASAIINDTQHFETILDFFRYAISQAHSRGLYYGHGTDNARDDIWSLIAGSLSLPFEYDDLMSARLTEIEKKRLTDQLIRRLVDRVPVPYLIHEARFCDLSFYVDERVLIPRSPIAELIETQFSPWIDEPDSVHQILDLCTGSACIAIACCAYFPEAHVDAVDLSPDALAVAEINCNRHGCESQLDLIQSDCWEHVPQKQYDVIVSNPPYVSDDEMAVLPPEYRHEPDLALRAAKHGLMIVEKILQLAHHYLSPEGILVIEVGNAETALIEAYPELPFVWLEFERGGRGVFLLTRKQLEVLKN